MRSEPQKLIHLPAKKIILGLGETAPVHFCAGFLSFADSCEVFFSLLRLRRPACAIAPTPRLNESVRNNNNLFSPRRSINLLIYFFNSILVRRIFVVCNYFGLALSLLCLYKTGSFRHLLRRGSGGSQWFEVSDLV
jgi:hypothetical protein